MKRSSTDDHLPANRTVSNEATPHGESPETRTRTLPLRRRLHFHCASDSWHPQEESNLRTKFRKLLLYPLSYAGLEASERIELSIKRFAGVTLTTWVRGHVRALRDWANRRNSDQYYVSPYEPPRHRA